jgi:mannose-6-phosphate isomerase-like protein (cupin superfamily)
MQTAQTNGNDVIDVLGLQIKLLTSLAMAEDAFCLVSSTMGLGAVVPLHSHPDREILYILDGELEAFVGDRWRLLQAGDVLDVTDSIKHALRNLTAHPVRLLVSTTVRMGRFFNEIGRSPLAAAAEVPLAQDIERLLTTSVRYSYWNATPEENAAIGISLPFMG